MGSSRGRNDERARDDGDPPDSTVERNPDRDTDVEGLLDRPSPSLDAVLDILRNRRRRLVLELFEEHDGETTIGELAEHIGGIENDKPPAALSAQERKRVYIGLRQSHLPKMDGAGAIQFDQSRGTIQGGPHIDVFRAYLAWQPPDGVSPSWPYVTVAGAILLAVGAVVLYASGPVAALVVVSLVLLFGYTAIRAAGNGRVPKL